MTGLLILLTLVSFNSATSLPTFLENPPNIKYRLPTHVTPINYNITLVPRLKDNFTFAGTSIITLKVNEISKNITLHAQELNFVKSSIVLKQGTENIPVNNVLYKEYSDFVIITFTNNIVGEYNLTLKYTANLLDDGYGMYYGAYTDDSDKDV